MTPLRLRQRVVLEFVGTALLLAAVVGSGIMAERLAAGNTVLALLCNTVATAGALLALITALGPLCGAHLNPIVTAAEALSGARPWSEVLPYALAQTLGALAGVALANAMFGEPLLFASRHARSGPAQLLGEAVATFGLVFVIFVCAKARPPAVPSAVAAYITAAYWFTSSTSFANPAVTIARSLSDTFAGIRPADVPGFIAAQLVGAVLALAIVRYALAPATVRRRPRERRMRAATTATRRTSSARRAGRSISAEANRVIALGCDTGDVQGLARVDEDWGVEDIDGLDLDAVRAIRDGVKRRVLGLAGAIKRGQLGMACAITDDP